VQHRGIPFLAPGGHLSGDDLRRNPQDRNVRIQRRGRRFRKRRVVNVLLQGRELLFRLIETSCGRQRYRAREAPRAARERTIESRPFVGEDLAPAPKAHHRPVRGRRTHPDEMNVVRVIT
jgi:hypothetical protein